MTDGIIGKEGEIILPGDLIHQLKLSPGTRFIVEPLDDESFVLRKIEANARKMYIELTNRCNLSCKTCIRNSWDEEEIGDMSRELFANLLAQRNALPELKLLSIGGFGEPLMHPEIFDFITMAREAGLEVEMITNGLLLTPDYAERLINSGLNRLTISIDGFEPDTYEDIRLGSDLPTVLDNLRYINEARKKESSGSPDIGLEFVLMKRNLADLQKVMDLAIELRLTYVIVTNVMPYTEELKDEILYDGSFEGTFTLPVEMQLRAERFCRFVQNGAFVVSWDGKVSPCYALMRSHPCYILGQKKQMKSYIVGDANEHALVEIWTAEEYMRFRGKVKRFDFPSCTDCSVRDYCHMVETNEIDCWMNTPSCADCLWARNIIRCP